MSSPPPNKYQLQPMETIIGKDILVASKLLEQGELVAIPTETVYGLAANALDENAVIKIFEVKRRPRFNPLIIHLPSWDRIAPYVTDIPEAARLLAQRFTPGPLTILLPRSSRIPDLVTAGSPKVAVRIPAHPLTQALLQRLDFPLAAPSANPFGYVSPTTAQHVFENLQGHIPYILDGGPCTVGVESTIVDFEGERIIVRRKGGLALEEIEAVAGAPVVLRTAAEEHPVAPGQLRSHYATATPLFAGDLRSLFQRHAGKKICIIAFGDNAAGLDAWCVLQLSERGHLDEAAKNLFAVMRQADRCGADVIIAGLLPEKGLGLAINDRLLRASAEHLPHGN